jgi:hypothetical protein
MVVPNSEEIRDLETGLFRELFYLKTILRVEKAGKFVVETWEVLHEEYTPQN